MTSVVPSRLGKTWARRVHRFRRRARIAGADATRSVSWYLGGGKRFFGAFTADVVASHRWCFIVGCNNSGTSLLQTLLESTGQVSTFVAEGQQYTRVLKRSERRGYERVWSEYMNELEVGQGNEAERVPRLVHDWLTSLPRPIRNVIVEKTPANAVRMEWLQENFPGACFIGLVRNGYAVCEGIRRKGQKPVDRGARHWNKVNEYMLERAGNIDRFLEVRYEDLAEHCDATLARICQHIGILRGPAGREASEAGRALADIGEIRNMNPESMARLSDGDRRLIYENAAEMLDHFGYTAP